VHHDGTPMPGPAAPGKYDKAVADDLDGASRSFVYCRLFQMRFFVELRNTRLVISTVT